MCDVRCLHPDDSRRVWYIIVNDDMFVTFFVARSLARRFLRTYFILRSTSRYLAYYLPTAVSTKVVNNREYYVCMDHAMMNEMVVR